MKNLTLAENSCDNFEPFFEFWPKKWRRYGVNEWINRRINWGNTDGKPRIKDIFGVADNSSHREVNKNCNWKPTENIGEHNGNQSQSHNRLSFHALCISRIASRNVGRVKNRAVGPSHITRYQEVEHTKNRKTILPGWILFTGKL